MGYNTQMKILVVDDFAMMRKIVKGVLAKLGMTNIEEAEDGEQAFKMLQAGNFEFLITDWNMPNVTGLELLKKVRADAKLKALPVILVTAEAEQSQIMEAIQAGVNNYVTKPFTPDTLKVKIEKIFGT
ncbi:MAG: chemotaxis response regulator CheY [Candidatus Magnetominusculus sp. LBB02]|nr:chemotaxis response regulator CheY [Candidatus Magnetominusculus sp. LBB02]